ncbi:MAG TPA: M1 family metallopeptidase, partial [Verrucomicrobiae bacterium]|nr:M1 family metallopeptidase [Verrucomicrobiae bacterium]
MSLRSGHYYFGLLLAVLFGHGINRGEMFCAGGFRGAAPVDSPQYRKYAPDRQVDIIHLKIDVTPDFQEQSVTGQTQIRIRPLRPDLRELKLNAEDLRVQDVAATVPVRTFQSTSDELIIYFSEPLAENSEQEVTIKYKAFPKHGLYFRSASMGYLPEDEHLFSQGEDTEARHWFPCYDAPNDKSTSEVICHVPEKMTVLSNGHLISENPEANGLKSVHWLQDKPHSAYLISLVAGYFKKVEDRYKDIPLAFYTPSSQAAFAQTSFAETKEMMEFFENEIGVPYPWDKYYQVCVQDFMWGGMENTSVTTLTDSTLFPKETENIHSSQGLVAHELAHQWFGDLVTCRDWSQVWLNEGFATYYAHLYNRHKDGTNDFLYGLYNSARGWINRTVTEDSRPIVFRKYDQPLELFGYLIYPKGGWVLHMLRNELGAEVYRQAIKAYLEQHRFENVVTRDLMAACEKVSGRSLDRFFDQWVFHPHHPELKAAYHWDDKQKLAALSISQVQQLTNDVALFNFALKVRFKTKSGYTDHVLEVDKKQEDFFIPLSEAPEGVRLDPEYVLLAKIDFELPRKFLETQLKDEADVMGRIFALEQLSKGKDSATANLIAERLEKDAFYGVRLEAASALSKIRSKEALAALIKNARQSDARVRQKVASEIANFFDPAAAEFATQLIAAEQNPEIKAQAVRALGAYPDKQFHNLLTENLRTASYHNTVANGAISAMRAQRDPAFVEPLIELIKTNERAFTARGLAEALETIAHLSRNEENKDRSYDFLVGYTSN